MEEGIQPEAQLTSLSQGDYFVLARVQSARVGRAVARRDVRVVRGDVRHRDDGPQDGRGHDLQPLLEHALVL